MNYTKFLLGGIAGGVVSFLLGWLVYGNLLADFMAAHAGSATGVNKTMDEFVWWSLILGNLAWGLFIAYIFTQWTNTTSIIEGARIAGIAGLFVACSIDFSFYATSNIMGLRATGADILAWIIMSAIDGAVVAYVVGMMGKKDAS